MEFIKRLYPDTDRFVYDQKLCQTRQSCYRTISEYDAQIKKIYTQYCFCYNLRPAEQSIREDEYFMKGLHPEASLELLKHKIVSRSEVIAYISAIERKLIESQVIRNPRSKSASEDSNKEGETKIRHCKKHGNCLHTTEQCRELRKNEKKRQVDINKSNKFYINFIKVPAPNITAIELAGKHGDKRIVAQIDPGASISCISEEKINELGLSQSIEKEFLKIRVATGQEIHSLGSVMFKFMIDKIPGIEFKTKMHVIPGNLKFLLLGQHFLISEEAQLDYREATLRIANRYLTLDDLVSEF